MKTWMGLLAVGAAALGAFAADRTDDGYGLIEAFTSTGTYSGDVAPFRWYSSALSGGNVGGTSTHAIDRTGANAWAPQGVYQLERYGNGQKVTFTGLVPGASYVAELHLSENYFGGSASGNGTGRRLFNVTVNGVQVESSLDIYATAGGAWRGLCRQYETTADSNGKVLITLTTVKDNAHWSGAAIFGASVPSAPTSFAAIPSTSTADMSLTWDSSTDVHRYYVQKGETAEGPWTDLAEILPEDSGSYTLVGAYDETQPYHYRVVASNGVGTAASSVASYTPSTTGGVSLMTRGSTIADAASETYRINTLGAASDPVNALAADSVAAHALYLDYAGDSELSLASGQTFTLDVLGVSETGGNLSITGDGSLVAGASTFNLSVVNAASTARVDVAVTGAGVLAKNGPGRAELNGGYTGFTPIIVNEGTLSVSNSTDVALPVLKGSGVFEKTGEGTLAITNANPDFTGDVVVRDGTMQFQVTSPFSSEEGRIVVKDGAAIDVTDGSLANQLRIASRTIVVEGSGPDGKGAIVNTTATTEYNAFANGELSGDVTFGGGTTLDANKGRWDFRNGALAMNGHNIEKVGSNMVCLTGIALTEGGTVRIDVKEGYWSSETSTSYSGGSANVLDVYDGAYFDLYNLMTPFTWTLNLRDGATYNVRNSTSAARNVINGPVCLAGGTATAKVVAGKETTFNGVVSGEGKLFLNSGSGSRLSLMNAANTYSGGTLVYGGDLYADSHGSLPGYGSSDTLCVSNGTLIVSYADGKWSGDDVQALSDAGVLFNSASFLGLSVTNDAALDRAITFSKGSLSLYDGGTLRVTQPITLNDGSLEVRAETGIVFDGAFTNAVSSRYFGAAGTTLVLTNGATMQVSSTSSDTVLNGAYGNPALAFVEEGSALEVSTDCAINTGTKGLMVASGDGHSGILTVNGGTVRHKIILGGGSPAGGGALIQNGGFVENQGGAANDIRYGNNGYGYVELNDGTHTWWGYGTLGGPNAASRGVMYQHGGTFDYVAKTDGGRLGFSRGGCGVLYMDGGTIDFTAQGALLAVGESDNPTVGTDAFSTMTVDGEGVLADFGNKTTWFGNRTNHTAVINLNNGGTLRTGQFQTSPTFSADRDTVVALLNFDGGVYKAPGNITMFHGSASKQPDAVTVYPGGAVFDTDAKNLTVNVPLRRPEGSGVASISVPSALTSETRLVGPPLVRISGGGGRGATAICLYDSKTRKVTGVKVTSPGTGYTTVPTVTFEGGIAATNRYTGTATLAANAATGGLTKRGSGVLYLAATNTFGGTVKIEKGELCPLCTNAIPVGADVAIDGGCLVSDVVLELGAVTATSGSVNNVTLDCSSFTKSGDGVLTLKEATIGSSTPVAVNGGRLHVVAPCAGLLEGFVTPYANWTDTPLDNKVVASTYMANTTEGWGSQVTAVYSGYVWNNAESNVTWTLIEDFDDAVNVYIDDVQVLYNAGWDTVTKANVTLSPGAHKFEARFGQGSGEAGPSSSTSMRQWTAKNDTPIGFAIDFEGRDSFDGTLYTIPVDPGDGSLFTTSKDITSTVSPFGTSGVTVASGATLSFNSGAAISIPNLAGAGVVSNASVIASGTWTFDAEDFTAGDCMTFAGGSVDLGRVSSYAFTNASGLNPKGKSVVIAVAENGFTGTESLSSATLTGLPGGGAWHVSVVGNTLTLSPVIGTVIMFR